MAQHLQFEIRPLTQFWRGFWETIDIGLALNLSPCFTPVESPESNGVAEAFVKTFKRDYVRVRPIPDAVTGFSCIERGVAAR